MGSLKKKDPLYVTFPISKMWDPCNEGVYCAARALKIMPKKQLDELDETAASEELLEDICDQQPSVRDLELSLEEVMSMPPGWSVWCWTAVHVEEDDQKRLEAIFEDAYERFLSGLFGKKGGVPADLQDSEGRARDRHCGVPQWYWQIADQRFVIEARSKFSDTRVNLEKPRDWAYLRLYKALTAALIADGTWREDG